MAESLYSHDAVKRPDDPARRQRAALAQIYRGDYGGPWTDNRRAQQDALRGEVYLAVKAVQSAVQGVTAQLTRLRTSGPLRRNKAFVLKSLPTGHAHANDEQRRPVLTGPLVELFDRPNAADTLATFLTKWRVQQVTTGNVLVWGNPDRAGRVREMFVLPTSLCVWQPLFTQEYPRGAWRVTSAGYTQAGLPLGAGSGALIPAHQVTRFRDLAHPLYYWDGFSPLTGVSKWVDVIEAIDRSCWSTMQRGVRRGTLVVVPGITPEEAAEQQQRINASKGGPDNAGDTWIVGCTNPGATPPEVHDPDTAREMDFQTSRQNYSALVMAALGVPPVVAGVKDGGGYAAYYAEMKRFRDWTLAPWLSAVAADLTRGVVSTWDDGNDGLKLQLDLPPFQNEEAVEGTKSRQQTGGLVTYNEARRGDNLPPVNDPDADTLPITVYLAKQQQKAAPPPQQPDGDPLAALAGGGPGAGDAPDPDNTAGTGSLPPRAKAFSVGDWLAHRGYA